MQTPNSCRSIRRVLVSSAAIVVLSFGAYADTITGTPGPDALRGTSTADTIRGLGGSDTILGLGGNDTAYGGAGPGDTGETGSDVILGGPGLDTLLGNGGNDFIFGGPGADDIGGGPGNDYIEGGPAPDVMRGALGGDLFRFLSASESPGSVGDEISDFNFVQGDRLHVEGVDANTEIAGDQAFTRFRQVGFTNHGFVPTYCPGRAGIIQVEDRADGLHVHFCTDTTPAIGMNILLRDNHDLANFSLKWFLP